MWITSVDTQLVIGLHVHVLSPSLLRVPRKTTWGTRWHASRESGNGAMLAPEDGSICATRTVWDKSPPYCDKGVPQIVSGSRNAKGGFSRFSVQPPTPQLRQAPGRVKILGTFQRLPLLLVNSESQGDKPRISKICTEGWEYILKRGR